MVVVVEEEEEEDGGPVFATGRKFSRAHVARKKKEKKNRFTAKLFLPRIVSSHTHTRTISVFCPAHADITGLVNYL